MGNGELGFSSGEIVCDTADTSKEGSRRVNYFVELFRGSEKRSEGMSALQFGYSDCLLEGKSGASRRGNTSSYSVYSCCWKVRSNSRILIP